MKFVALAFWFYVGRALAAQCRSGRVGPGQAHVAASVRMPYVGRPTVEYRSAVLPVPLLRYLAPPPPAIPGPVARPARGGTAVHAARRR